MNTHFHLQQDQQQIAWLHIHTQGDGPNVLSAEVLNALDEVLLDAAQMHPAGLVLLSDKPSGFIAGADVKSFARLRDAEPARQLILRAHDILQRLEALPCPSVALIHGYCLGGGLELALACDYRVASDAPDTRLGFPELRLGIFPGFGGTVRSIRLLGDVAAMQLMLSSRTLSAPSAQRIGLVDHALPPRQLKNAARSLILNPPQRHKPAWHQRLAGAAPVRPLLARSMRKQVAQRAPKTHYPAPYRLIDHWRHHATDDSALYASEAQSVSELLMLPQTQNLIRVFLLQEQLKRHAKSSRFQAQHVHVIGGGIMGGDIAAWCASQGLDVTLQDRTPAALTPAMSRANIFFRRKLKDRRLVRQAMDRLLPDPAGHGIARADVVIEAIFEDLEAKRNLYAATEPKMRDHALLLSNTSSIPLQQLSARLKQPRHLLGLHFFNPVAKMPLVEIVHQHHSPQSKIADVAAFTRQIGKLPLPVKSHPGFLVNRILMPYLLEAVYLLEESVAAEQIDRAATDFGMPMGPVELADTVGLDICLSVAEKMQDVLNLPVPTLLQRKVDAGELGRKSAQGFYSWQKGKPQRHHAKTDSDKQQLYQDRLILPLLNQSQACLHEGIVESTDLLDAGVIFGTGFAPFRGGPLHYSQQIGVERIVSKLQELEYTYGERFAPAPGWEGFKD